MLSFFRKSNFPKKSFTVIELLTAIVVFTFVIMATLGIYTVTIQRHFQAQKNQTVDEELRFAMELMAKDIKDGLLVGSANQYENNAVGIIYIANKNKLGQQDYNDCLNDEVGANKEKCVMYKMDESNNPEQNGIWVKYGSSDPAGGVRLTSKRIKLKSYESCPGCGSGFQILAEKTSQANPKEDSPLIKIYIMAQSAKDEESLSLIGLKTRVNQEELGNYYKYSLP